MLLDTLPDVAFDRTLHADEARLRQGSLTLALRALSDGTVLRVESEAGSLELAVRDGALTYAACTLDRQSLLEAEDTAPLDDGTWHAVAVVVDPAGTRLYLDGYQVFAGTVTTFLHGLGPDARLVVGQDTAISVRALDISGRVLSAQQVRAVAHRPRPTVQFAANALSDYDVRGLAGLHDGSIALRYRVRGPRQGGTLLAASGEGEERLRLTVSVDGLTFAVVGRDGDWRSFHAPGTWDDGRWHDVVVTAARGAVDVCVDGFRELHAPGQAFFADVPGLDRVVIGQDTHGARLWGEVGRAAVHAVPLNDSQVKLLADAAPLDTVAVFDRGLCGAASYRIPAVVRTPSGTLIAGADQRTAIANDSPNHIQFVVRRSGDDGRTWGPVQVVVESAGSGADGASVIDSCPVVDEEVGRVVVLIDHFPGGVGQPTNAPGTGMTDDGHLLLTDRAGAQYVLLDDGSVVTADGEATPYRVDAQGAVTRDGEPGGNIHLKEGSDPRETLLTARTCFLQALWSDDDGETWEGPFDLNHQVKEPWMRFLGTGPGTGIQLRHGPHRGRLVVPVYYEGEHPKRVSSAVVYSDDHGRTWRRGASPNDGRELDGRVLDSRTIEDDDASLHESTVVERTDGSLLMLMRNQHPSGCVLASHSHDGGQTWGEVTPDPVLPEIFCQPNAIRVAADTDEVVFANASQMLPFRGNGVLRLSRNGGETWAASRTLNPGHHVYQSMVALPNGDVGVLWENEWQGLYFTHVPRQWFGV